MCCLVKIFYIFIFLIFTPTSLRASIFGEENIALMKLVVGQIVELERLAEAVEISKDQTEILTKINDGIFKALDQIEAFEEILKRAQGLNPKNIKKISDLTALINEVKEIKNQVKTILSLKLAIADEAIAQASIQADTSYIMGQEMIKVGASLSQESKEASPGRASQISAASGSAQMMGQWVSLQILSHIAQLQAMHLELEKTKIENELSAEDERVRFLTKEIIAKSTKQNLVKNQLKAAKL